MTAMTARSSLSSFPATCRQRSEGRTVVTNVSMIQRSSLANCRSMFLMVFLINLSSSDLWC